jgi:hypothetical protein
MCRLWQPYLNPTITPSPNLLFVDMGRTRQITLGNNPYLALACGNLIKVRDAAVFDVCQVLPGSVEVPIGTSGLLETNQRAQVLDEME